MKLLKQDYKQYLSRAGELDYVMIDPPWNYGMQGSKLQDMTEEVTNYEYWDKDNELEVADVLLRINETGAKMVAMWTTLPMLESVMAACKSNAIPYDFRSMITWVKVHRSGKPASVMAHYFQNTTEYLVILKNKKLRDKVPRTKIRTHLIAERGDRTVKPKCLETELMNSWPGKWAYIFGGPFVNHLKLNDNVELDCVDICYEENDKIHGVL